MRKASRAEKRGEKRGKRLGGLTRGEVWGWAYWSCVPPFPFGPFSPGVLRTGENPLLKGSRGPPPGGHSASFLDSDLKTGSDGLTWAALWVRRSCQDLPHVAFLASTAPVFSSTISAPSLPLSFLISSFAFLSFYLVFSVFLFSLFSLPLVYPQGCAPTTSTSPL